MHVYWYWPDITPSRTPLTMHPEGIQGGENLLLGPQESWGAYQRKGFIPFSRGSSRPRDWIHISCVFLHWQVDFFFFFLTAELSGKPRNDFREPRFLHFPIHRKALKSLPQNACFLFFNSNRLLFQIPDFSCKNCYTCWPLPHLLRAVPWSYQRGHLPGLGSQQVHRVKHNFQLLGCVLKGCLKDLDMPSRCLPLPLSLTSETIPLASFLLLMINPRFKHKTMIFESLSGSTLLFLF